MHFIKRILDGITARLGGERSFENISRSSDVGHFSPIGDYDRERQRVFVLDVDPSIKRSYWVNERTFQKSMATIDTDGKPPKHRGFLIISW